MNKIGKKIDKNWPKIGQKLRKMGQKFRFSHPKCDMEGGRRGRRGRGATCVPPSDVQKDKNFVSKRYKFGKFSKNEEFSSGIPNFACEKAVLRVILTCFLANFMVFCLRKLAIPIF